MNQLWNSHMCKLIQFETASRSAMTSRKSRGRKYKGKRNTEFDTTAWGVFFNIMVPLSVLVASLLFAWLVLR